MRLCDVVVFQCATTDEITDNGAALTFLMVLEPNCYHSVSGDATPPALMAVFSAYFARGDQFEIAVLADVVVASVAL